MVFKILIADDEPIACEAVASIIQKNFQETVEIKSVHSGREALKTAAYFLPDLILMDIRMPGLNGIETIRELKRRYTETVFIVITAYDDFDIVVEALKLGVLDYLLKPVKVPALKESLEKAREQIQITRAEHEEKLSIKDSLYRLIPELEQRFLHKLMIGNLTGIRENGYMEVLGLPTECGACFGIIVDTAGTKDIRHILERIRYFAKKDPFCIAGQIQDDRLMILKFSDMEKSDRTDWIQRTAKELQTAAREEAVFVCAGDYCTSLEELRNAYLQISGALDNWTGRNNVICMKAKAIPENPRTEYPLDLEQDVFREIQMGFRQEAHDKTVQLFEVFSQISHGNQQRLNNLIRKFVAALIRFHMSVGADEETSDSIDIFVDPIEQMNSCIRAVEILCRKCTQIENKSANENIKQAIKYINENYMKDLSLSDVASYTGLSPYYFTRLFKSEMGMTFVRYLTSVRIKNAKRIMRESPAASIKEICYAIGYNDPKYFSKAFQNIEKQSPSDYRASLKQSKIPEQD